MIYTALGKYTPPEQWLDVMHIAAQCGLPMSLDAAGKALGLPEEQAKMKEGKALIRYFCCPCKPTKTNGGHERNFPEHAPERWKTFCDYCIRDTEAERTIFHMLEQWLPNEDERRFWALDQRINERGVRIDRQLAINAVAMDERYQAELDELRRINEDIDDVVMSEKISRLERVSDRIFDQARDNPDKLPQMRKFMDYYLPTAKKLLKTYAELEEQGIKPGTIRLSIGTENADDLIAALDDAFAAV